MPIATPADPPQRRGEVLALLAVACFSIAPIFVLVANPSFTALEIAFWRLAIGAGFVGMLGLFTRTAMRIGPGQWRRFVLYGLALALHLSAYVASLSFTSIAHVVALTYTSPVWITILSAIFLRERPTVGALAGLVVAIAGIVILSGFQPNYGACDIGHGHCAIVGDGLALAAGLFSAIYSVIGRIERARHPLFRYTFHVYGWAALWLLPAEIILAARHAYPLPAIGAVIALGLIPLGIGHTLYNAALRRANPTLINLIVTQEITGGIILGALVLHQFPTMLSLIGVVVTLAGIVIVMLNPPRVVAAPLVTPPE